MSFTQVSPDSAMLSKGRPSGSRTTGGAVRTAEPIARTRLVAPRLSWGDRVAVVSPGSTPNPEAVERCMLTLSQWGLRPELGRHALVRRGYLAGSDAERLADLNQALRDPGIRAVFATRGGKGSYRIAADMDVGACARNPKLLIGFSDVTVLSLKLARDAGLVSLHGLMVSWDEGFVDLDAIERFRRAIMTDDPITVPADLGAPTGALTNGGKKVTGPLYGGNQDALATAAGWALPPMHGAILLLEGFNLRLGHIDRQLTMLRNARHLDGIAGVAVGHYTACGPEDWEPAEWSYLDVLREHLERWNVPVLGGLPFGHEPHPYSIPIGGLATLDPRAGTLVVDAAVR